MGPVGAGKTTAIHTLSDIEVVHTEARATDATRHLKATTTVSMDVGVLHLPGNDKLRLYGAPGQDRFDFMWDILLEQAKAAIVLVNHAAPHPERDVIDPFGRAADVEHAVAEPRRRAHEGIGEGLVHAVALRHHHGDIEGERGRRRDDAQKQHDPAHAGAKVRT